MTESHALPPAPRRRALVFLPLIVFAALAGLFFYQLRSGGDPSALPSTLIGKPVPEMSLPPLAELARDGKTLPGLATGDLKSGGVSVVNIFASWCGPCRDEHPVLMKLAGLDKARLVAISVPSAIPMRPWASTSTAVPPSIGASMACRRPSWSMPRARSSTRLSAR
jgi:cytochrome c biogenesis protein CcmG/thiol:disulfide interchange protein DsbE